MKNEKNTLVFVLQKYGKFCIISLGHFIKHKPLISEEWCHYLFLRIFNFTNLKKYISYSNDSDLQKEAEVDDLTIEPQDKNNNDHLIDKNDERIHEAKMNTFVGFIRLANFLSATTGHY